MISNSTIFSAVVILSGWALGYALARQMRGKTQPGPGAILASLIAVATPTIMAFVLASEEQRQGLLQQFRPGNWDYWGLLAVGIAALIAGAGHVAGAFSTKGFSVIRLDRKGVRNVAGMFPMLLIWALLEEIGWRGYLLSELMNQYGMGVLAASAFVGLLWGIWHAPQMLFNQQLKEAMGGRVALGMFLWSLQCVLFGGVLGWLQYRSGSFLIPALAHALVNGFGNISDASLGKEKNPVLAGTSGLVASCVSAAILVIAFI